MARTGRPKAPLILDEQEREQLERWTRRAKSTQSLALRSRIVLACADGADNKSVAADLRCSSATVGKWRGRVVEHPLDGTVDEGRPRRERAITPPPGGEVGIAAPEAPPQNAP